MGLGTNLGDREGHLQAALTLLEAPDLHVTRVSSIYETAPMYDTAQPAFLNMVAEGETTLFPRQLLHRLQKIENELGRLRTRPNGPRTIDLDLLLYGRTISGAADLTIPHPRLAERRFVLEPLAELAPGLRHPVLHRTMKELLREVADQQVRKV